jgi:hypothetical protein
MGRRQITQACLATCLATCVVLALSLPALAGADGPLTHNQVIKRGDRICYDNDTNINAARRQHRPYSPFATYHDNLAALARHAIRINKRGLRRFERLIRRAPADGEKWRLKAYIRGARRQQDRTRELAQAADAGNLQKVNAIAYKIERYKRKYRRHGRAYGFEDCGYA